MKYDFTTIPDRKGIIALDAASRFCPNAEDPIPMWIADMSFTLAPPVRKAIDKRLDQAAFGYYRPGEDYWQAIINWRKRREGIEIPRECLGYENGVHGGNINALRVLCAAGAKILLHVPAYSTFLSNMEMLGYHGIFSELKRDEHGVWRMDFEDTEKKLVENDIHVLLFCSPQNPTGRVWERWELERLMDICRRHDVYVISDEIWADLVMPGHQHIPTQSVSEDAKMRTIAMYAPTKTFSLAGLIGSYHVIYSPYLRSRMWDESERAHYNYPNALSVAALLGAYSEEGWEWAEELRQVLAANRDYACDYIAQNFQGVDFFKPEGTYMLFIDCAKWCQQHGKTLDDVLQAGWNAGVIWQDGRGFKGPTHIRMNLSLPTERLKEALRRLDQYVFNV